MVIHLGIGQEPLFLTPGDQFLQLRLLLLAHDLVAYMIGKKIELKIIAWNYIFQKDVLDFS